VSYSTTTDGGGQFWLIEGSGYSRSLHRVVIENFESWFGPKRDSSKSFIVGFLLVFSPEMPAGASGKRSSHASCVDVVCPLHRGHNVVEGFSKLLVTTNTSTTTAVVTE
jgi:hypothetical protein